MDANVGRGREMLHHKWRWIFIPALLLLLVSACSIGAKEGSKEVNAEAVFAADDYEGQLTIHFFHLLAEESAAQSGEAIFIKTPEGKTMMIDAGKPESGPLIDEHLDQMGVDKIDLVMPSHPHVDHIGGFQTLFETKEIGKVMDINLPLETGAYKKYEKLIEEKDIELEHPDKGDIIEIEKDLTIEILNPPKEMVKEYLKMGNLSAGIVNDLSMVMKLTYKDQTFLFTGDIYKGIEDQLVNAYNEALDVDVVVVSHHGLGTSSSKKFVEATDPDIAVIPTNLLMDKSVYDIYKDQGSDVLVSQMDGNILLATDGKKIDIITENELNDTELDSTKE